MNLKVLCTNCGRPYPEEGVPYRCRCGGVFDYAEPFRFDPQEVEPDHRGVWRYRAFFGLPASAKPITLGKAIRRSFRLKRLGRGST